MVELDTLQKVLGVSFKNLSLLEQALVHSSYINENPAVASNERLEFLGDVVLGLIVAERLYQGQESATEGEMTRLRAALVNQDTLSRVAESINLGSFLLLGKGEESAGGRRKPANLASALEAVIAAVYLDQGLEVACDMVLKLFVSEIEAVSQKRDVPDHKSRLQEIVQAKGQGTPVYRLVTMVGPDHDRVFTVDVLAGGKVLARGSGRNKKVAETEAAKKALAKLSESMVQEGD